MTRKLTFLILALFALIAGPGWGQNYVKVTSTGDLTDGQYLIVYETGNVALNGMLTADAAQNTVAVTISNNTIESTSAIDAAALTFTASNGSFLGGGGKYIGHSGSSNTLNYSENPLENVVTFDNGNVVITAGSYVMKFNKSSGQERFRYYKSGQEAIQLYKQSTSSKTLTSLAISGTPTKTTYNAGEEFNPAGLVVTGTYDDTSTAEITSGITWTVTPRPLTAGTTSVSVTATVDEVESDPYEVTGLTVNEHVVTPGTYEITPNNTFFGIEVQTTGSHDPVTGTQNDITITHSGGSSFYCNASQIRTYKDNTLTFSVPSGYEITSIVLAVTNDATYSANVGTYTISTKTWTGNANKVILTSGQSSGNYQITKITVTFATRKTLESIAIKTPPTKTEYYAGETFNPAGLVITATYDDESTEDIAYTGNESKFTFSPGLTTALTTTNKSVTITYGGKTVNQTITVTEAPKLTATISINGATSSTHDITEVELPTSATAPTGFTFAGWTTTESDVDPTHFVSGTVQLTANTTFYAVYAREESGETTTPDAYTAGEEGSFVIATLVEGIYYAIPTNPTVISGKITGVAIETESVNNVTYVSAENANGYTWTIADATYGQTLYDGNKYLYHSNGGNSGTNLTYGNSTSYTWSIISETNGLSFQAMNGKIVNDRGLLYQMGSANVFGGYSLSNEDDSNYSRIIVLPIVSNSSTTHYYTRVFLNETAEANITISGPSIIPAGSILNMGTYTLTNSTNSTASNLIIEDGAQLIHHNAGVKATVLKNIKGYSDEASRDGYYLIANPTDESNIVNLTSNNYDLYAFDAAQEDEWRNAKVENFEVERGTGYLYANSATTTLEFAGELTPASEIEVTLVKATAGTGIDFPGFNLIGNPYACNAYPTDEGGNFMSYYKMNEDGSELTLVKNVEAIAPCEGFFVEAATTGQSVTISTTAPTAPDKMMSLNVSNESNIGTIDRAIVNFDGRNNLHKFMLNPDHTNISLAMNGEDFAAISTEAEGELPVNFKAEKNGTYTITVNTENIDAEYLHLIDNMTGMDIDVLATPSYTFEAKTSDYASRFKLVFNVNNAASANSDSNFAYMSDGNLVISDIEGEATLQIIDMMGRVVSTETVSGNYSKALNLRAGAYVLNLNGMTQKIVVE